MKANMKSKPGVVAAPMVGIVQDVGVQLGVEVQKGHALCILIAMKMEIVVSAPLRGKIVKINVKQGQQISAGDLLFEIE